MEEAQDLARAHGLAKLTLSHLECCLAVLKQFPTSSHVKHLLASLA